MALPGADDEYGVAVHTFWRGKKEQIRISLNEYKGHNYIDIRSFFLAQDGLRPSKKGVTISREQFPELFQGVIQLGDALGYGADELLTWLNKTEANP
ncbi:MAG: hypothetical protein EXR60_03860 [Dehalococcoidia bacterium]|nr:hypothetical protein [Dehalococcoidia bacterium]